MYIILLRWEHDPSLLVFASQNGSVAIRESFCCDDATAKYYHEEKTKKLGFLIVLFMKK